MTEVKHACSAKLVAKLLPYPVSCLSSSQYRISGNFRC